MKALWHWLFPWQTVRETFVYRYQQHRTTGARRAVPKNAGFVWQPLDNDWLCRRAPKRLTPPSQGSGGKK